MHIVHRREQKNAESGETAKSAKMLVQATFKKPSGYILKKSIPMSSDILYYYVARYFPVPLSHLGPSKFKTIILYTYIIINWTEMVFNNICVIFFDTDIT